MSIEVPGLPLISLTASFKVSPFTKVSSSLIIKSPLFRPALNAGVSSIGVMTSTNPSFIPTSIPKPPNSPAVPCDRSLYLSLSR